MTRKEFNAKITSIARVARKQLIELKGKEKELNGRRKDYSSQYVREKLEPQINEVCEEIKRVRSAAQAEAAQVTKEFTESLRMSDTLNPADMNDDVKLLNCGVGLTERDLKDMLARNNGNRTMTQLILRYADEHKIETGVYYVKAEEEAKNMMYGVEKTLGVVMNFPENEHAFNQLFGPGTAFSDE